MNRYQTYLNNGFSDEEIQNHLRPKYREAGFTDEQIDDYFKQNQSAPVYKSNIAKGTAQGVTQGATFGQAPHLAGVTNELANLPKKYQSISKFGDIVKMYKDLGKDYVKGREDFKKEYNTFTEEHPWLSLVSEIAGGGLTGGAVSGAIKGLVKNAIARGTTEGGIYGLGYGASNTEGKTFDPVAAGTGTAAGAAGGALLGLAQKALGKIFLSKNKGRVGNEIRPEGVQEHSMQHILNDKEVAKEVAKGGIGDRVAEFNSDATDSFSKAREAIDKEIKNAYSGISDETMISLNKATNSIKQMEDEIAKYERLAGKDPEAQKAITKAKEKLDVIKKEVQENFEKSFDYKTKVDETNYLDKLSEIAEKNKAHINIEQTPQQEYASLKDLEQINKYIKEAKPSIKIGNQDLLSELLKYKPENTVYNLDDIRAIRDLAKKYYSNAMQGVNEFVKRPELNGKIYFTGREKFFSANNQNKEALMQLPLVKHIIEKGKIHPFSEVSPEATNKIKKGVKGYYFITDIINVNGKNKLLGVSLEKDQFGNYFYNLNNNIIDNLQKKLGSRFYPTSQVGVQLPSTNIIAQKFKDVNKKIDFGKLKYHIDDLKTTVDNFYRDLPTGGQKLTRPQKEVEMFQNMSNILRNARDSHSPELKKATDLYSDMKRLNEEVAKINPEGLFGEEKIGRASSKLNKDISGDTFKLAEEKIRKILGKYPQLQNIDKFLSDLKKLQVANNIRPDKNYSSDLNLSKIAKFILKGGSRDQRMQSFAEAVRDGKITKDMLNQEFTRARKIPVFADIVNYYLAANKVPSVNNLSNIINKTSKARPFVERYVLPRIAIKDILHKYYNKEQ